MPFAIKAHDRFDIEHLPGLSIHALRTTRAITSVGSRRARFGCCGLHTAARNHLTTFALTLYYKQIGSQDAQCFLSAT